MVELSNVIVDDGNPYPLSSKLSGNSFFILSPLLIGIELDFWSLKSLLFIVIEYVIIKLHGTSIALILVKLKLSYSLNN